MKLFFPLTTSSLSESQYIRINKAHIPQALSSMGFNKTWPIALRFGCHPYGGLQLKHIEVEALIRKLRSVNDLLHKDDTSKAVKLLFHWYQTAAGISHPVLENPKHSTEYVNSKWTNDLIRMLSKYHVKIKLPDTNIPKLQRFNDKFIMDDILSYISSTKIRRQINACRLFLQITFISELTNINGTHLVNGILKGDKSKMSPTTQNWPKQGCPNSRTWKVWSKVITQLYCVKTHSNILKKENKLGYWLTSHSSRSQSHQFSYSPSHHEIYEQTTQGNRQWFASSVRASTFHIDQATEQKCDMIPTDSFPIKKYSNNSFRIKISHKIPQSIHSQPASFDEYIKQQPSWIRELIQHHSHNLKEESLLHHLTMNTPLLISTDGSKGSRRSGGSWIIALHNGTHITSGYNPNFGQIRQINSYRAEIYASLSVSLFLYYFAKYFMIVIGNAFIAICDNLSFVDKLSWLLEDDYNNHGLHKSTEQEAFHLILKTLPKTFSIEHVKGHQDDYKRYRDLPIKARLNIDADEIATSSSSIPLNHHIQSTKFIIYVNNEYAHHRIDHQIRIHSHAKQAKAFLCEKYSWNLSIFNPPNLLYM